MAGKLNIETFLYRHTFVLFIVFLLGALVAFWPNYFGRLGESQTQSIHFHGICMTLWCLMLISQAVLIRIKKPQIHKSLGILSYVLMPLVLGSGFHLVHLTLSRIPPQYGLSYSSVALMFNSLFLVAIFYGLAIYYRKHTTNHARFMVCTLIPMITPVTDRLTYFHFRSWVDGLPIVEGRPAVMLYGFALANGFLIIMSLWDILSKKKNYAFLLALFLNLIYNASVIFWYNTKLWRKFAEGLMSLPLS